MPRRKLSTKLLMAYGLVVLASLCLFGLPLHVMLRRSYVARATSRFEAGLATLEQALARTAEKGERLQLDELCGRLNAQFQGRVTLIARDGRVLADSLSARCVARARPECVPAIRANREQLLSQYMPLDDTVTVRLPVQLGGLGPATVRLALPLAPVRSQLRQMHVLLLLSGVAACALAVGLGLLISRRIARPVERMTVLAERIASGDFSCPVVPTGDDEIGRLAEALTCMQSSLRDNVRAITEERNQALAIMQNMTDGVLAVSAGGRVLLANASAAEMTGLVSVPESGTELGSLDLVPGLVDAIRDTAQSGSAAVVEVGDLTTGQRVLRASITPIGELSESGAAGVVAVLRDMTEARRVESLGRELVANASHQLRTPLAVVSSTAETLMGSSAWGEPEQREFVEIIVRHARRMEQLVAETLQLSQLEAEGRTDHWRWEQLDLTEVLQQALDLHAELAQERHVTLRLAQDTAAGSVEGVESLLLQALGNLVDNGIRYSPDGGHVDVSVATADGWVGFCVRDAGPGIPSSEQKRIFGRFVRGRHEASAAADGTGLGLAIVSRVAEIHGGTVALVSHPGQGSTFTLRIPETRHGVPSAPGGEITSAGARSV